MGDDETLSTGGPNPDVASSLLSPAKQWSASVLVVEVVVGNGSAHGLCWP